MYRQIKTGWDFCVLLKEKQTVKIHYVELDLETINLKREVYFLYMTWNSSHLKTGAGRDGYVLCEKHKHKMFLEGIFLPSQILVFIRECYIVI